MTTATARSSTPASKLATTPNILASSFVVQLGLLLYANHIDSHPERYGGLQYTDVDWRVVSDGAKLIFGRLGLGGNDVGQGQDQAALVEQGRLAEGWLVQDTGLPVGDPYERATFRYTPLLPLLLSSSVIHDLVGKLTLVCISLLVTPLLLASGAPFWPTHLIWTLNPFVLNITTRGSPEAIIVVLVVMLLLCLTNAQRSLYADERVVWETFGAVTLAMAVSWKIYPIIYVPAIWACLSRRYGWFGAEVWWFGIVTAACFGIINGFLWSIWGQPFLDHTFLYHLTRLDHRHNFSPYFYPIYHSLFPDSNPAFTASTGGHDILQRLSAFLARYPTITTVLQHPLISFLPQTTIVAYTGLALPGRIGLEGTMFFQTVLFVIFNKVVTSQYFIWFLPLLPYIIPHLRLSRARSITLLAIWIGAQALWLGMAYKLEFQGDSVHLQVWAAGLVLFGASCWVLGELLDNYEPPAYAAVQPVPARTKR